MTMTNFKFYNKYVKEYESVKGTTWSLFYWETSSLISLSKIVQKNLVTSYRLKFWFVTFKLFCSVEVNWHFYIELKFTLPFKSKS